jgi:hypothetical protein
VSKDGSILVYDSYEVPTMAAAALSKLGHFSNSIRSLDIDVNTRSPTRPTNFYQIQLPSTIIQKVILKQLQPFF